MQKVQFISPFFF